MGSCCRMRMVAWEMVGWAHSLCGFHPIGSVLLGYSKKTRCLCNFQIYLNQGIIDDCNCDHIYTSTNKHFALNARINYGFVQHFPSKLTDTFYKPILVFLAFSKNISMANSLVWNKPKFQPAVSKSQQTPVPNCFSSRIIVNPITFWAISCGLVVFPFKGGK